MLKRSITLFIIAILVMSFSAQITNIETKSLDNEMINESEFNLQPNTQNDETYMETVDTISLNQIGQFDDNEAGATYSVVSMNNIAYVADSSDGLEIYNITNPSKPVLLSRSSQIGTAYDIEVIGDLAYIGFDYGGLYIFDVSNKSDPVLLSRFDDNSIIAYNIDIIPGYALLANRNAGLHVVDIADPLNPFLVSSYDDGERGSVSDVSATGDMVILSDEDYGFEVIDISNKSNPVEIGNYSTGISSYADKNIEYFDNFLFLAEGSDGVKIYDMTDPTIPVLLSKTSTSRVEDFYIEGNLLFTAKDGGMEIFDITDYSNPTLLHDYNNNLSFRYPDVTVDGEIAILSALSEGMMLIDVSTTPTLVGKTNNKGTTMDMVKYGNYIFSAENSGGLEVIDVSDPSNPREVGNVTFDTGLNQNRAYEVELIDTTLYVWDQNEGVIALDVTNPENPQILGIYEAFAYPDNFAVSNHIVYLSSLDNYYVIDFNEVTNPQLVSTIAKNRTTTTEMQIKDNLLYTLGTDKTFNIFNISNYGSMDLISSTVVDYGAGAGDYDYPISLEINDTKVYMGGNTVDTLVYDISNISNPVIDTTIPSFGNWVYEIEIYNEWLLLTTGGSFEVYSMENPQSPVLTHQFSDTYDLRNFIFTSSYVYLAAGINGLIVIENPDLNIPDPQAPTNLFGYSTMDGIELSWSEPNTTEGLEIVNYNIYRSENFVNFSYIGSSYSNISYLDTSVEVETNYTYYVTSQTEISESNASQMYSLVYQGVPSAPQSFQLDYIDSLVMLNWIEPSYKGEENIAYNVYRGVSEDSYQIIANGIENTHFNDTDNLEFDTYYYYYVTAISSIGESAPSNVLGVRTVDDNNPEEPEEPENPDEPIDTEVPSLNSFGFIVIFSSLIGTYALRSRFRKQEY